MAGEHNTTSIIETDKDLVDLLSPPGADNILTATGIEAENGGKKPSLFQRKQVDLTFLDKPTPDTTGKTEEQLAAEKKVADDKIAADRIAAEIKKKEDIEKGILNPDGTPKGAPAAGESFEDIINNQDDLDPEKNKGTGRPKTDKSALLELTKKLIEKKMIIPFDDDKKIEDYTLQDFEELYEANDQEKAKKLEKDIPVKFFDSLPDKLKSAAAYVANGGTDLKAMFRALAEYEETAELDPATEVGQDAIIRQYLQSTKFGTSDEIEAQLNEWKDGGVANKKADQFKPKLETMKEQFIAHKLQEQEKLKAQHAEQANAYMKNIYEVLEPGELNGIKLEKKTQSMLYAGLVQPNYTSITGKNTNMLGHLLEKYQFVEPRHDLIAEALWLLADPEGYKNKLREGGKTDAVKNTVRQLKTEEKNKVASTSAPEDNEDESKKITKIPRPSAGTFFKR